MNYHKFHDNISKINTLYFIRYSPAATLIYIWVDPLCLMFYRATQSPLSLQVVREAPSTLYDSGTIYHRVRGHQWALSTSTMFVDPGQDGWRTSSFNPHPPLSCHLYLSGPPVLDVLQGNPISTLPPGVERSPSTLYDPGTIYLRVRGP